MRIEILRNRVYENCVMDVENLQNSKPNTVIGKTKFLKDGDIFETVLFHAGAMGRYQKLLFAAMMLFGWIYALTYFSQIFITVTPQNYWCRVPELSNLSLGLRRNLSAPGAASAATDDWNHCMTFDTNWTEVLETLTPPPDGTPLVPCQYGWEFELSDIPYKTVSSEREWVCDHATYVPTAQSVFFVGSIIGTFVFGFIADSYGRVPAIIGTNLIGGIFGVATIFTTGVWDFLLCRFFVGLSFDNCFTIAYVLILEFVGSQYRTLVANYGLAFSFTVAATALPWMAYYIADWRVLAWVVTIPMFLVVILAPWFLPESIRWLVSKGHGDKAVPILKKIERINKTKIPDEVFEDFQIYSNKAKLEEKQTIFGMCKSPLLRKTLLSLILVFMGCGCVFDGLMRMFDTFGLSFFAVFSANEFSEFIAVLLVALILDRLGRRYFTTGTGLLCCILAFIAIFTPEGLPRASFATLSRLFMTACYTATIQWSTEIIPTPFRASGVATLHLSAYCANIISPFIAYSERFWSKLPMLIFTALALISSGICFTLPETTGIPMPQTKTDGENLILEQSYFHRKKKRRDTKKVFQ